MSISRQQRFSRRNPCPICGGFDEALRGKGVRCFGFLSDDGEWAHCTRSDHAGGLDQNADSQTYLHRLNGSCNCGVQHGPDATRPQQRIVASYPYRDEQGTLLHEVVRFDPKAFAQRRPDPSAPGGWVWNLNSTRRVLYNLPEVLDADVVYITEGEKDVETLRRLGITATTNAGGAGKWRDEYSQYLHGKRLVILPDNDEPGRKHALEVAQSLLPVADKLKIVEIPSAKDVSTFFEAGGTKDQLAQIITATPLLNAAELSALRTRWLPDEPPGQSAGKRPAATAAPGKDRGEARTSVVDWPAPIPFLNRNVPPLPADLLPGFLGEMVAAVSRATETPVELPALLGLAVVSATVSKKVTVSPEPGYVEPVNLYTAAAMESGNRKTAVLNMMAQPFTDWERAKAQEAEPEIKRLTSERKTQEARIERLRTQAAKASDPALLIAEITQLEAALPEVPKLPRLWVQDVTPEKLAAVMAEQGERIALLSDEGGIFDVLAGRYSKGVPNLDLFLQAHAGSPVRVDRTSRPPVVMHNPLLTVGISPQPDVLQSLSDKPGFRGRGLIARFLYALPPSLLGRRHLDPTPCPAAVEREYRHGIERLLRLSPPVDDSGAWQPWRLRLSKSAYDAWKEFQRAVELLMREGGKLHGLKDWASKLPGTAARVAGVLHCVIADPSEAAVIDEDTAEQALNLAVALMDHAVAVYGLMDRDAEIEDAQKILAWIQRKGEPTFTARDCFCAHQSRFKRMDTIYAPLHLLEKHAYIRLAPEPEPNPNKPKGPGRPSEVYEVNPKALEVPA